MNRSLALRRSASGPMDGLSCPLRTAEAKPCGMPLLHHASIATLLSRPSNATGLKTVPALCHYRNQCAFLRKLHEACDVLQPPTGSDGALNDP